MSKVAPLNVPAGLSVGPEVFLDTIAWSEGQVMLAIRCPGERSCRQTAALRNILFMLRIIGS